MWEIRVYDKDHNEVRQEKAETKEAAEDAMDWLQGHGYDQEHGFSMDVYFVAA